MSRAFEKAARVSRPKKIVERQWPIPGYRLAPGWIGEMRRKHHDMLTAPWNETSSIALYEMNAQFHEGLVAGANNRYLLVAIQQ